MLKKSIAPIGQDVSLINSSCIYLYNEVRISGPQIDSKISSYIYPYKWIAHHAHLSHEPGLPGQVYLYAKYPVMFDMSALFSRFESLIQNREIIFL